MRCTDLRQYVQCNSNLQSQNKIFNEIKLKLKYEIEDIVCKCFDTINRKKNRNMVLMVFEEINITAIYMLIKKMRIESGDDPD